MGELRTSKERLFLSDFNEFVWIRVVRILI